MILREIKNIDPLNCYVNLKDDEYPFLLDSSTDHEKLGRYSLSSSNPFLTFSSRDDTITIKERDGAGRTFSGNPFLELDKLLNRFKREKGPLIFSSGAVGYFSYDMGHHIETLPKRAEEDVVLPHSFFGFYDTVFVHDHLLNKSFAAFDDLIHDVPKEEAERRLDEFTAKISNEITADFQETKKALRLESNFLKNAYADGTRKVLKYISSGDIYQANLSQRFSADYDGDAISFYKNFIDMSPAPFGALIDIKDAVIMSNSPERYLKRVGDYIETRPIKGTRPRSEDSAEDERLKRELKESEKDLAEHLMIVDLERNDLGRVSEYGSVKVDEFLIIESYSNVHHLVSTVSGRLKEGVTSVECIMNSFPGGSITGAPKIRSMEIIDEIEPTTRSIYTGAIGYFDLSGDFDFNIAIRTAIYCKNPAGQGRLYFQVGGGIVADSDPGLEYEETLIKAKNFLKAAGVSIKENEK
jgi:para-aminobenzoate synthetase component 1